MSSARRTRYEVEIIGGCREVKAMAMDLLQYAVGIILLVSLALGLMRGRQADRVTLHTPARTGSDAPLRTILKKRDSGGA
jgi:hypothetical protein